MTASASDAVFEGEVENQFLKGISDLNAARSSQSAAKGKRKAADSASEPELVLKSFSELQQLCNDSDGKKIAAAQLSQAMIPLSWPQRRTPQQPLPDPLQDGMEQGLDAPEQAASASAATSTASTAAAPTASTASTPSTSAAQDLHGCRNSHATSTASSASTAAAHGVPPPAPVQPANGLSEADALLASAV